GRLLIYVYFFGENKYVVELPAQALHQAFGFTAASEIADFHPVIRFFIADVGVDIFIQGFKPGLFGIGRAAVWPRINLDPKPHGCGSGCIFLVHRFTAFRCSVDAGCLSVSLHDAVVGCVLYSYDAYLSVTWRESY